MLLLSQSDRTCCPVMFPWPTITICFVALEVPMATYRLSHLPRQNILIISISVNKAIYFHAIVNKRSTWHNRIFFQFNQTKFRIVMTYRKLHTGSRYDALSPTQCSKGEFLIPYETSSKLKVLLVQNLFCAVCHLRRHLLIYF